MHRAEPPGCQPTRKPAERGYIARGRDRPGRGGPARIRVTKRVGTGWVPGVSDLAMQTRWFCSGGNLSFGGRLLLGEADRPPAATATIEPASSPFLNSTLTLGPPAVLKVWVVTFFALPPAPPLPLRATCECRRSMSSRLGGPPWPRAHGGFFLRVVDPGELVGLGRPDLAGVHGSLDLLGERQQRERLGHRRLGDPQLLGELGWEIPRESIRAL